MITLVIGGARSGKSAVAERLALEAAGQGRSVTYVATMTTDADDPDLRRRLADHRARRPTGWETIEPPYDLPHVLDDVDGVVLVDSLGPWVSARPDMAVDVDRLVDALRRREGTTVLVSDEVGWGVHPESDAGRRFRDALGELNQAVASTADHVLLVVAGRTLVLEQP